jgi:hypothetical protein
MKVLISTTHSLDLGKAGKHKMRINTVRLMRLPNTEKTIIKHNYIQCLNGNRISDVRMLKNTKYLIWFKLFKGKNKVFPYWIKQRTPWWKKEKK